MATSKNYTYLLLAVSNLANFRSEIFFLFFDTIAKLEACSSGEDECDMPKRPHGRHPYLKDRLRERLQRA